MRDDTDPLLERARAFLARHGLLRPEALLLVAVSGGPDSLALLHLLRRLRAGGGPALHIAHLDHGARPEAAAEAEAVAALAANWGLPATVARRDVPALAAAASEGLMAAARRARYAFLAETALATGATALAVAHQADDQAETVLMHLLRGAGPAGLRGMRDAVPWREWGPDGGREEAGPPLLRPLLSTTRREVEAYCRAHGLAPSEDPSNRAERFARVRVRRALRELAAENPRVVAALGRTARILADDYDYMQGQLDAAWPALAEETPAGLLLRRPAWEGLHPALQRYAVRRAVALLGQPELSLEQVERFRDLFELVGRRVRLSPHVRAEVGQGQILLVAASAAPHPPGPQLPADALPLPLPGSVELGGGWRVAATDQLPDPSMAQGPTPPGWARLDGAALDGPLVLRRRRPGDRFRPAGGRGSRKLQDFFVDRRLPQALRDAWPLLATPGAIVWVVGLRADERFVAAEATQGTIWVSLTH